MAPREGTFAQAKAVSAQELRGAHPPRRRAAPRADGARALAAGARRAPVRGEHGPGRPRAVRHLAPAKILSRVARRAASQPPGREVKALDRRSSSIRRSASGQPPVLLLHHPGDGDAVLRLRDGIGAPARYRGSVVAGSAPPARPAGRGASSEVCRWGDGLPVTRRAPARCRAPPPSASDRRRSPHRRRRWPTGWGGTAPARKQRGVHVEASPARRVEHVLGEDAPVGRHHRHLRLQRAQARARSRLPFSFGGWSTGTPGPLRLLLHRRGLHVPPARAGRSGHRGHHRPGLEAGRRARARRSPASRRSEPRLPASRVHLRRPSSRRVLAASERRVSRGRGSRWRARLQRGSSSCSRRRTASTVAWNSAKSSRGSSWFRSGAPARISAPRRGAGTGPQARAPARRCGG